MRPRGIAFAVEAISNLEYEDKTVYDRLERVIIAKIDEFNTHYLVKIMNSYQKVGQGSGELYDSLIYQIMQQMDKMMYQDLLRFFEIYPEVVYIYENTMSAESYKYFIDNMEQVLTLKKFPMQDVCRVFNVLSRNCQFCEPQMFIKT